MSNQQTLSFVACQNHYSKDGFHTNEGFNKIYPIGNGMFKCSLCAKEFTREEIRHIVEDDYNHMIQDLIHNYQQNLAKLYADKKGNLDVVDAG
jgi:fructose-1,6-bisphosphatase